MIDIHSHILHGLDDGAKTIEQSIMMAKEAYDDGIRIIVATPHHKNGIYDNATSTVKSKVTNLNNILKKEKIDVTILPGLEIRAYGELVEDLKQGHLLSINENNRYVFLELPHDYVPKFVDQLVFDIQLAGYIPIIPHPERNMAFRENPLILYRLIKRGALSQITACSVFGEFGRKVRRFALELIEHNLAHLVATDAHALGKKRGPKLSEAYKAIEKNVGIGVSRLFQANALSVIEGKDIWIAEPEKIDRKIFLGIV